MAVTKTGAIYKSLVFGSEDSRNFGVYITGEAVFNAPEREVEMITIPGRNGTFALDKGRFENIEVTYPAGLFAGTEADFAEAVSNFRNMLCSKRGYARLTDGYNPNEYRMAIYKSGLEVTPAMLTAGEFEITFDCKPQRYLTSGETAVVVADGGTVTNPTRFESSPLLEVRGSGEIKFNGYSVGITGGNLGNVVALDDRSFDKQDSVIDETIAFDTQYANTGDDIHFTTNLTAQFRARGNIGWSPGDITFTGNFAEEPHYAGSSDSMIWRFSQYDTTDFVFQYGTPYEYTETGTSSITSGLFQMDATVRIIYDGADSIRIYAEPTMTTTTSYSVNCWADASNVKVEIDSTQSVLGNPLYIDCEIGEAYKVEGGVPVSINGSTFLGSKLPKLAPGDNEFEIDNTISQLKIVPRWWKV